MPHIGTLRPASLKNWNWRQQARFTSRLSDGQSRQRKKSIEKSSKNLKGWSMDVLNEFPLIDEHGKRYREFGRGCREYAPTLVTSAGEVPIGTVIYKKMQEEPTAQRKDCPFRGGLYPRCTEDCSFYENGKCKPGTAQAGKRCPLPAHLTCGDSCMMYKDGRCTIFAAGRKKK